MITRAVNIFTALKTWSDTRGLQARFPGRADFETWQHKKLRAWIDRHARKVPYYRDIPRGAGLAAFPVIDKTVLMENFHLFNRPGIAAAAGWKAFEGSRRIGQYHVGASTGTSGNRGLYVISDRERYAWLGAMLGKLLPDIWRRSERVAVILPLHTRLYDAANDTGRIGLRFFDLSEGFEAWLPDLVRLDPTIIVAPPRVLRWLAENAPSTLHPRRLLAGAEVLDPIDRVAIEKRWPGTLGQIYMATEGLLATTCLHGSLHLAEDIMHFKLEAVGSSGLVSPIITDFRRSTQIMCRYRMNDLLSISPSPCACGSPMRAVEEIVGRQDDTFIFHAGGKEILITPDVLRNAVLDADRSIDDFRIVQDETAEITLILPIPTTTIAQNAAKTAIERMLARRELSATIAVQQRELLPDCGKKLRRVMRKGPVLR